MKSMTGYGHSSGQTEDVNVEISVKCVNGRFLEVRFHLPREFVQFEADLKKLLQKSFQRGTVDIYISRKLKPLASLIEVNVNRTLALKYQNAVKQLARELKLKSPSHVESFMRFPDVLTATETTHHTAAEKKVLLKTMQSALANCDRERKREGKVLRGDLENLLEELDVQVKKVQEHRDEANEALLAKFEQRIKGRLGQIELDPARLSQEVVFQIEKSDINEELSRLREHCRHYKNLFAENQPVGKKLDFYTQELLREVNTIGSKSSISKLTQNVVEAKTIIERLREQVQNVE